MNLNWKSNIIKILKEEKKDYTNQKEKWNGMSRFHHLYVSNLIKMDLEKFQI